MITLKEAMVVCDVKIDEIVYIIQNVRPLPIRTPMTLKDVRDKYDMQKTMVTRISPYFCCGDFEGLAFEIKKSD